MTITPSTIWRTQLGSAQKSILIRLAHDAGAGGLVGVAVARICADCSLTAKTVRTALGALESSGVLILDRDVDYASRMPRRYRIDADRLAQLATAQIAPQSKSTPLELTGVESAPVPQATPTNSGPPTASVEEVGLDLLWRRHGIGVDRGLRILNGLRKLAADDEWLIEQLRAAEVIADPFNSVVAAIHERRGMTA